MNGLIHIRYIASFQKCSLLLLIIFLLQEKKRVGEKRIAKEAEKSQGNPRSQKLSRRRGINKKTKHVKKMNNSLDWTIWKILGTFESIV